MEILRPPSGARSGGRALVLSLSLIASAVAATSGPGSAEARDEYEVKAAFLLNFARLVSWPEGALAANQPLLIGLAGEEYADEALERGLAGADVRGHPVQTRRLESAADVQRCHVLFVVGDGEPEAGLLDAARASHVLSVGESAGFAGRGGVIRFFSETKRIRFEIDRAAAKAAGLRVSSRLLRVARVAGEGP